MDDLDKILDVEPSVAIIDHIHRLPALIPEEEKKQSDSDFDYARTNMIDVVEKTRDALDDMMEIAKQSQHPKAYEVVNSVLKTLADVSTGIVDLQLKKEKLDRVLTGGQDNPAQQIMNNLFVGSTSELQKMLQDIKNSTPE